MRKVSVYSSLGDNVYENITATTWGEMKEIIERDYSSLSGLSVFEKVTKVEYSTPEALLPEGDFILFIYQKKNKSGISYSEMRDRIKALKTAFGQEATEHFGNYTILNFQALESLLKDWDSKHAVIGAKTVTLEDIAAVISRNTGYTKETILNILNKEFGVSDPNKEEYERFRESVS